MEATRSSTDILVRGLEGLCIWKGPPFSHNEPSIELQNIPCYSSQFCEDGTALMVVKPNSTISIFECKNFQEIRSFEILDILAATLSPRGNFLQTFQKPVSPQTKNVVLWNVKTGDPLFQHFQKNKSKTTWPLIHFNSDESVACHFATNEIRFFDPENFSIGTNHRLRVLGVAAIELSKVTGSHVAAFVPGSKGSPASVQIYTCQKGTETHVVSRRSFFRCTSVQLSWNRSSSGLLIIVQSDVDQTNQSYYGETKLNYLTTDGIYEGTVPLRKDGPVYDAQWSYSGSEFAVVYGFMPACATIFDKKCNPMFEVGTGPYNTFRWNPKGKFICLAGFGNLPGDMDFWDYVEKRKIGSTRSECAVSSEWSPDGRYFMTATTAPRLQVDNKIKIFNFNGSLYFEKMFNKLYEAEWRPQSPDMYDDINELTDSAASLKIGESKSQGARPNASKAASSNIVQKPAAYRPPHAKHVATIQAELLGMKTSEQPSKNAMKNKKKREKQKEKKALGIDSHNISGNHGT